jgi:hypothetical protein
MHSIPYGYTMRVIPTLFVTNITTNFICEILMSYTQMKQIGNIKVKLILHTPSTYVWGKIIT